MPLVMLFDDVCTLKLVNSIKRFIPLCSASLRQSKATEVSCVVKKLLTNLLNKITVSFSLNGNLALFYLVNVQPGRGTGKEVSILWSSSSLGPLNLQRPPVPKKELLFQAVPQPLECVRPISISEFLKEERKKN